MRPFDYVRADDVAARLTRPSDAFASATGSSN
jgi:hypothetical protein